MKVTILEYLGKGMYLVVSDDGQTAMCTEEDIERLREMSPLWEMAQEGIDLKTINWTTH